MLTLFLTYAGKKMDEIPLAGKDTDYDAQLKCNNDTTESSCSENC